MATRTTFATGIRAGASVCALVLACGNSATPPSPPSTTPVGATPVTSPGMASCATLRQGCFTFNGGSYPMPATSATCPTPGQPTVGPADSHCAGRPPQTVSAAACGPSSGGPSSDDGGADAGDVDAGSAIDDAGPPPAPGPCAENAGQYGATMYGTSGADDDCKYQLSYTASPICQNNGTYFVLTASYLSRGNAPLTGACATAELCLSNTHPAPAVDARPPTGKQQVVEGPPGTYTMGPVQFDAPGDWTVRFHFNEFCCDLSSESPHGHAAFHVTVP